MTSKVYRRSKLQKKLYRKNEQNWKSETKKEYYNNSDDEEKSTLSKPLLLFEIIKELKKQCCCKIKLDKVRVCEACVIIQEINGKYYLLLSNYKKKDKYNEWKWKSGLIYNDSIWINN